MDELNKKLAEWAGFKKSSLYVEQWIYPDIGESGKLDELFDDVPNFTDSLDACFKWLVPKLKRVGLWTTPKGFFRWEVISLDKDNYYNSYYAERGNPALALCRAIEKLIDGEKK